jgi:GNAT superfamily N-acetyltransferase
MLNGNTLKRQLVLGTLAGAVFEPASVADAAELADLGALFFAETGYAQRGVVYDRDRACAALTDALHRGTSPHVVVRVGGKIVGLLSYVLDHTFCERPIACMTKIYVVPEHRASAIGRVLLGLAAATAADVDGACMFLASFSSEIKETKTLENLFARAGFERVGSVMARAL